MRFEALRETLLRAGIAPRHVRRYLRELDDHLADLTEAQIADGHETADAAARARARLGGDEELAAAMLARPGFKSWAARWPWLVFGLAPLAVMPVIFFAAALPLVLSSDFRGAMNSGIPAPGWFLSVLNLIALFANLVLGPGLAALLVTAAWRQRLNWKWALLASALIAVLGLHMTAHFPATGRRAHIDISTLIWGTWPNLRISYGSHDFGPNLAVPLMLAQFLLTLAPALTLLWMQRRQVRFVRPAESR